MSLIIEGLKTAQQLRLKKLNEAPFITDRSSRIVKGKGRRESSWIFVSAGVSSLLLLALAGINLWPLLISHQKQKIATVEERKAPIPLAAKSDLPEVFREDLPLRAGKPRRPAQDIHSIFREAGHPAAKSPFILAKAPAPVSPEDEATPTSLSLSTAKEPEVPLIKSLADASKEKKVDSSPRTKTEKVEAPIPIAPQNEEKREEPSMKSLADGSEVMKAGPSLKSSTIKEEMPLPPASQGGEAVEGGSIAVKQAAENNPTLSAEVPTRFNLGIHFYQQKEILKAIQAYQKVIELDPNYIEAYNNLGIIYQEMGDLEKALEAYQNSININPGYEKAYNNRGIVLYLQGRDEEALESFQKALGLNPQNIESYINMGVLFKKKGQIGKAIESYQKALAINPSHGETHYNLGLLCEEMGNFDLAIQHYHNVVQLFSKTHPDLISKVQRRLNYLMVTIENKRK
jgi:superkiller protein 3